MSRSNETRVAWVLMRVDERESLYESFFNSHAMVKRDRSCMRVDESLQAKFCERVLLNSCALVKREQELQESWQARVFMRVFSILICPSQSYQELHESWSELTNESLYESFLNFYVLVKREKEHPRVRASQLRGMTYLPWWDLTSKSLYESFSELSCPGQTRTKVEWELMKVDKQVFVWEFTQLLCPSQTKARVWGLYESWQAIVCMRRFSQLSCFRQTRTGVEWELMKVHRREFVWEFSQLSCSASNENKSCMRVDESWQARVAVQTRMIVKINFILGKKI